MWLISRFFNWWQHSYMSRWHAYYLIKKHHINSNAYHYNTTNTPPTLAELIARWPARKQTIPNRHLRPLLLPVAGNIHAQEPYRLSLALLPYHYHRIHTPIGGKIHHYTNSNGTITTIHFFSPDGLTVSLTITTPYYPGSVLLAYNKRRNYHLPGTEIGIIVAPKATITIDTNIPITIPPIAPTDLACLTTISNGTSPAAPVNPSAERPLLL